MKISRLYLKIFFAFIAVLGTAILTIAILMHLGKIRPPFARHADERTEAFKRLILLEIGDAKRMTPQLQQRLASVLDIFAGSFNGQAWLTDAQGTVLNAPSPKKMMLIETEETEFETTTSNGNSLYLMGNKDKKLLYMVGTIESAMQPLSIHILHEWKKRKEEVWLMHGLLLMSGIAALLLIPVSRMITLPINKLTASAELIAQGDFSPRVDDKRKDEVGTLATAFNHMANSLDKIVRGSRELTANLSHELRSPLARIRISQQIIEERMASGRTDGIKKHVHKMEQEIDHMDGLIDKILKLSKLDLQKASPRIDTVNIPNLVKQTVELLLPQINEKGLSIISNETEITPLLCNREDITMVVGNVLTNAIKYSPAHSDIAINCTSDEKTVNVKVSNPYPQLSKNELETIFIPFKRLGYDAVEGTGLGLAFARKIVEEHEGTMQAVSNETGFHMTITLPAG